MIPALGWTIAYIIMCVMFASVFTLACFTFRLMRFGFGMWSVYLNRPITPRRYE